MSGLDLHFVHGRKVLTTPDGQLAAAIADVLLRGFSHTRIVRLVSLLRRHGTRGVPAAALSGADRQFL
jgi:hypothetical protein